MAATTNTTATSAAAATPAMGSPSADDLTAKAANKRYEGLIMVRGKAMKGKGAWYWTHFEPMLVHNTETGLPKAVKLRCSLCDAVFSASNPSRTATEHLKRGTCPNFNSLAKPISSISPTSPVVSSSPPSSSVHHHRRQNHRKRTSSSSATRTTTTTPYQVQPLAVVNPSRFHSGGDHLPTSATSSAAATPTSLLTARQHQQQLMLSGGKDDLGALAMLEDSVKKLKSPKTSQAPTLSKSQIQNAIDYLADWVYETSGSVSFSSLEHPKFKSFLNQVGLPEIPRTELTGTRLDSKYRELKAECESRIRDAMFFQIASDGWKFNNYSNNNLKNYEEHVVNLSLNLPNGTSLYRKAVFFTGSSCSKYAEEVLWETITGINGSVPQQCVGIVADKFKSKALKNLENQNQWMVNLSCQFQGFISLIKDFNKELHLFKNVTANCVKLANFVNQKAQIRHSFHKYQIQEYGHAWLLRSPPPPPPRSDFSKDFNLRLVYTMMEDVLSSSRTLQSILLDESFKLLSMEDENVREVENMIRDPGFWNELEAMYSLVQLVKDMAHEIEIERPLIGQCLPLWNELRARVKNWSSKFPDIGEKESINNVIERRFNKNYHPAWSAAYILDPLYLVPDTNGKFIPPFKFITSEQEKDVNNLITRLVSGDGDEAHIALMELMKWRTEGLVPVYARAVQMKERDPITGKMRIANPQSSRLVWETYLTEFKSLGRIAVRLIFLHATCCGIKCENSSMLRRICGHGRRSRIGLDRAQKIMFIAAHSKLERRDFSSDEDKEVEALLSEDDVLNEVFVDTSSV